MERTVGMFRARPLLPGWMVEPESFDLPMKKGPECGAFCIPGLPIIHTPSLTSSDPHLQTWLEAWKARSWTVAL